METLQASKKENPIADSNHLTEALQDFFQHNGISNFVLQNETLVIPNKTRKEFKSSRYVLVCEMKQKITLHVALPFFPIPPALPADVGKRVFLSCIYLDIPFANYEELKVTRTRNNLGVTVASLEDRGTTKELYDECSICMEKQHPICVSINCFHEVCQSCSAGLQDCPHCREVAAWKVLPNHKQKIERIASHEVAITWIPLVDYTPLDYYCETCNKEFRAEDLSFHQFVCYRLPKEQLTAINARPASKKKIFNISPTGFNEYLQNNRK